MKLSIRNFLLSLTLLVPALQQIACADEVTYLYRSWNKDTKTLTTETRTADATPLRSVAKDGEWMGLGDGWYYMEGDRINIQTLNILGKDVHLILGDGTIFECYGGIKLEEGNCLSMVSRKAMVPVTSGLTRARPAVLKATTKWRASVPARMPRWATSTSMADASRQRAVNMPPASVAAAIMNIINNQM